MIQLLSRFLSHAVSRQFIGGLAHSASSQKQYFLWLLISRSPIAPFHFHMTACTLVDRPQKKGNWNKSFSNIISKRNFRHAYPTHCGKSHILKKYQLFVYIFKKYIFAVCIRLKIQFSCLFTFSIIFQLFVYFSKLQFSCLFTFFVYISAVCLPLKNIF